MQTPDSSITAAASKTVQGPSAADGLAVISDFSRLASMEADLSKLAEAYSPTPFFLAGLLRAYFKPGGRDQFPLAITMREKGRLVGLAAFRAKDQYLLSRPRLMRYRSAEFLLPDVVTPDFVVSPDHRREFVEGVLSTLFDNLGCQTALLILPTDSPNIAVMKSWCRMRRMGVWSSRTSSHAVIQVSSDWPSYQASLGSWFVRGVMKSKRRLEREGRLKITSGVVDNQAVIDEILEVDRHSWKEGWRKGKGKTAEGTTEEGTDEMLETFLNYYQHSPPSGMVPRFWIMELDGRPISFSVVSVMGKVAYLGKTSYDLRYAHFSPGTVLLARVFQDLFESEKVSRMDFFTMQDYQRHWQPKELTRDAFLIDGHKGAIGALARLARSRYGKPFIRKLRRRSTHEDTQGDRTMEKPTSGA